MSALINRSNLLIRKSAAHSFAVRVASSPLPAAGLSDSTCTRTAPARPRLLPRHLRGAAGRLAGACGETGRGDCRQPEGTGVLGMKAMTPPAPPQGAFAMPGLFASTGAHPAARQLGDMQGGILRAIAGFIRIRRPGSDPFAGRSEEDSP